MNAQTSSKSANGNVQKTFLFENDGTTLGTNILNVAHVHGGQEVKLQYGDFVKGIQSKLGFFIGMTSFQGKTTPVIDLPTLMGTKSIQQKLLEMKNTKQAHINFIEKLERLVFNQIRKLTGEPHEELDFDLQLDHTQCAFGKALFGYMKTFEHNHDLLNYLQSFVEPHRNFHSKVAIIKENLNNADKIQEILADIKENDFPKLLGLFEKFDNYITEQLKKVKYMFIKGQDGNIIGVRVDAMKGIADLEMTDHSVLGETIKAAKTPDGKIIPELQIDDLEGMRKLKELIGKQLSTNLELTPDQGNGIEEKTTLIDKGDEVKVA